MDNTKPIRVLLIAALAAYGLYCLLYLGVVFGQPHTTRFFGGTDSLEPFYSLPDIVILVFSAAARALLTVLALRNLHGRQVFLPVGICCLVLLVLLPIFVSPIYSILYTRFIATQGGYQHLAAYSVLNGALRFVVPLATLSSMAMITACAMAWYRGRYLCPPPAPTQWPDNR